MIKVIKKSKHLNNYIVTIAIGGKFFKNWKVYSYESWLKYSKKFNIGIIVITKDLISKDDKNWKNANWQKFLIGNALKKSKIKINNVCYLDTDIIINESSPNIFEFHDENKFSVISKRFNLPFESYSALMTKISLLRKLYLDKNYPLNSALNMSIENLYKFHKLKNQKNEFCSGVFVFNVRKFSDIMTKWFYKYNKKIVTITGGEQTHLNYEILKTKKVKWLSYKFQAIWLYEMAYKYPFLYFIKKPKLIQYCIYSALFENYFLHFAGKWPDGNMWKYSKIQKNFFFSDKIVKLYNNNKEYLKGTSKGVIKSKNKL